jgi:hypothetical protein
MCDITTALVGAGVASSVLGSFSRLAEGVEAQQTAEYNASIRDLNAAETIDAATENEAKFRIRGRRLMALQQAQFAGAGIDPQSPSAVDLAYLTAQNLERDAIDIRRGGQVEAGQLRREAAGVRLEGTARRRVSQFSAAQELLTNIPRWAALT